MDMYQQADGRWAMQIGSTLTTYTTEQEAIMNTAPSAVTRWWQSCQRDILTPGASVHAGLLAISRLSGAAHAAIEATPEGEIVPGTPLTREEALLLMVCAQATLTLINTPVVEGGPTIGEVIARHA